MRFSAFVLYSVLGLTATSSAIAQTQTYTLINGIKVEAMAVSSAKVTSSGQVIQGIQFRAQSGTTPPKFFDRAVQFNKGTTGASIKAFGKRNALGLGLTAITLGLGWAIDSITGDIYSSPATPTPYTAPAGYYWKMEGYNGTSASTPYASALLWFNMYGLDANYRLEIDTSYGNTPYSIRYRIMEISPYRPYVSATSVMMTPQNGYASGLPSPYPTTAPTDVNQTKTQAPTIPTDTEVSDAVVPLLTPSDLPKLNTDPVTGALQKPQETLDKMTEVANQYARELNPNSVNVTAPTAVPLTPIEKPATDTLPQSTMLPEFCSWATTVCAWLDWTAETGDEPLDADFQFQDKITYINPEQVNYNSGLSGGTCPSPASFTVLGTSLSYSYEPICDLASVARIFVLLFAYLSSIYIIMGIKQ